MIDIHTHILPRFDDGARCLEEAVQMARTAVKNGISEVVATPHVNSGIYRNTPEQILAGVKYLQMVLDKKGIPLKIHPGAEVLIHENILSEFKENRVMTLADSHVFILLELPFTNIPLFTDKVLSQLQKEGLKIVIAHPERHLVLQDNLEVLFGWIKNGVYIQVTAGSILGYWGKKAYSATKTLLKEGKIHLLASDAHGTEKRVIELIEAYQAVEKYCGQNYVGLLQNNARSVVDGGSLLFLAEERRDSFIREYINKFKSGSF